MEKVSLFDLYDNEPFEDVDALLESIFPTLAEPQTRRPTDTVDMLGSFIEARLVNMDWSPADLAEKLGDKPTFIQALISGSLPEESISDDLITRVAVALEYEPNVLRILLGRDFIPTLEVEAEPQPVDEAELPVDFEAYEPVYDSLDQEIEQRMHEITNFLLETIEERYTIEIREDTRKARQHDFVIRQIEMILAKHRKDVRMVELLLDELKAADSPDRSTPGKDLHRLDIRRIIHFIRDHANSE